MRKVVIGLVAGMALAVPGTASAFSWTTLVTKSVGGSFAVKSFSRTVSHPNGLRLKNVATARGDVTWTIACSKGFSIRSVGGIWKPYPGTTTKTLPMGFTHPDSCDVVVAFGLAGLNGGSETLSLQKH